MRDEENKSDKRGEGLNKQTHAAEYAQQKAYDVLW